MQLTKTTIQVVTRLQDNGDGGYTLYAYNSDAELIADHPDNDGDMSEERAQEILDEEDPYEDGYIGSDTIEVTIDENGNATLTSPLSFRAGQ